MALTIHQMALRLAKHIGVTSFDPGDASNTNPLQHAALRGGDLDEVVACINGALQEMWKLAPRSVRALFPENCPVVKAQDVGAVNDSGAHLLLPDGWEESVLLPLALQRFLAHPDFQPQSAKAEIHRQAAMARRILHGLGGESPAATLQTDFR